MSHTIVRGALRERTESITDQGRTTHLVLRTGAGSERVDVSGPLTALVASTVSGTWMTAAGLRGDDGTLVADTLTAHPGMRL